MIKIICCLNLLAKTNLISFVKIILDFKKCGKYKCTINNLKITLFRVEFLLYNTLSIYNVIYFGLN